MKSAFKIIATAMETNQLNEVSLPTTRVDTRRLSVDEIKNYITEEFEKAREVSDVETQDPELGWADAELAKEIEWIKTLDLKEFFDKKR
jgi:hypothetical protein